MTTTPAAKKAAVTPAPDPGAHNPEKVDIDLAMSRVAWEVTQAGGVGKNGEFDATDGGKKNGARYKFRSVDDVMSAMSEPLARHGVKILPTEGQPQRERISERSVRTTMEISYRIRGPLGAADEITVTYWGEAADTSDKGANKARAVALKYLLTQVFCIPIDADSVDDPDRDRHEVDHREVDARHAAVATAQAIAVRALKAETSGQVFELGQLYRDTGLSEDVRVRIQGRSIPYKPFMTERFNTLGQQEQQAAEASQGGGQQSGQGSGRGGWERPSQGGQGGRNGVQRGGGAERIRQAVAANGPTPGQQYPDRPGGNGDEGPQGVTDPRDEGDGGISSQVSDADLMTAADSDRWEVSGPAQAEIDRREKAGTWTRPSTWKGGQDGWNDPS